MKILDDKQVARFFRQMNLLTERFFSGAEVNIDQLEQFSKTGNIEVAVNVITTEKPIKIMKSTVFNKQEVFIIKLQIDFRDHKIYALLKEQFSPVNSFIEGKNTKFMSFVENEIIEDKNIYCKLKTGLKKETYPKIYGYGEFGNVPEPFFIEYIRKTGYMKEPLIKVFHTRGSAKHLRAVPNHLREATIIVVGKKI